jgi:hypothetical protein
MPRPHPPEFRQRAVDLAIRDRGGGARHRTAGRGGFIDQLHQGRLQEGHCGTGGTGSRIFAPSREGKPGGAMLAFRRRSWEASASQRGGS